MQKDQITSRHRYFVYAARSVASLIESQWRIESKIHGYREVDVPIESIPLVLRQPGTEVWVVWDRDRWEIEVVFARNTNDGSDLPDEWRELLNVQQQESG